MSSTKREGFPTKGEGFFAGSDTWEMMEETWAQHSKQVRGKDRPGRSLKDLRKERDELLLAEYDDE